MPLGQAMHDQTAKRREKGGASLGQAGKIRRELLAAHEPRGHGQQGAMLSIYGNSSGRFCDGVSRRNFLKIGGLGMGGLALPELLRAEAAAGVGRSHKALIMIYMAGAPPHQDLIDPKPNAPKEYRGDLAAIRTSVPGIHVSELLPRLARIMDKWTAIRSIMR